MDRAQRAERTGGYFGRYVTGAREVENQVADHIARSLAWYDGRDLGDPIRRDGLGGLSVDFTFDAAVPPVALEITSLADPDTSQLGWELIRLEQELEPTVVAEQLGVWAVGIHIGASRRSLYSPLLSLLRAHVSSGRIMLSAHRPLDDEPKDGSEPLPTELVTLGVRTAARINEGGELFVFPPLVDSIETHGFGELLAVAVAANASKLSAARPRESHLAIVVDRSDASGNPELTPPPKLPPDVDVLWVVLGYYNAKYTYRLWRTTGEGQRWQLLDHPLGEPPRYHA